MHKFNMPFQPVNIQSLTLFDGTDNDFSSYYNNTAQLNLYGHRRRGMWES
jgi:hypothetical protein